MARVVAVLLASHAALATALSGAASDAFIDPYPEVTIGPDAGPRKRRVVWCALLLAASVLLAAF